MEKWESYMPTYSALKSSPGFLLCCCNHCTLHTYIHSIPRTSTPSTQTATMAPVELSVTKVFTPQHTPRNSLPPCQPAAS